MTLRGPLRHNSRICRITCYLCRDLVQTVQHLCLRVGRYGAYTVPAPPKSAGTYVLHVAWPLVHVQVRYIDDVFIMDDGRATWAACCCGLPA